MILGALEAGTKMVMAVGNNEGRIIEKKTIPTETPSIIMPKIIDFFKGMGVDAWESVRSDRLI